jgi:hypothetical protein
MAGERPAVGETISVRDHSRPCEHGSLWAHWPESAKARWWREPDCPGGKEILLRRVGEGMWEEVGAGGE